MSTMKPIYFILIIGTSAPSTSLISLTWGKVITVFCQLEEGLVTD